MEDEYVEAGIIEADANKLRIAVLKDYVQIALLTTGPNPGFDSIIEISAARYRNHVVTKTYQTLVRPESYYLLTPFEAERMEDYCIVDGGPVYYIGKKKAEKTGITNEMLYHAKRQEEALDELLSFIGKDVIVGFEASLQIVFINALLQQQGGSTIKSHYVDVKELAKRMRKGAGNYTLFDVAAVYELPYAGAERATRESKITALLYEKLSEEIIARYGSLKTFEMRMNPSREYALPPTEGESAGRTDSLYGKVCVFTGTLSGMVRGRAMCLVRECGGTTGTSVTKKTDYLILGSKEYEKRKQGIKSTKLLKAERMISEGAPLKILSEEAFYQLSGWKKDL